MIVLDTTVVSVLMDAELDPRVERWLAGQDLGEFAISAMTRAEIRYGIARLPGGRRRELVQAAADQLFDSPAGRSLPFDGRAADLYGEIVARRERSGHPIGVLDAQIAAIARAHEAAVATRETGGFVDTGLIVVNPFDTQGA